MSSGFYEIGSGIVVTTKISEFKFHMDSATATLE